ncbi:hypothetical protein WISP_138507 [Willisornis vidua]|uniref:Uncharacterized protein n=1 Tax=Willisornis vidua TaxID=1566151 RepID=A0ABQ9CMY9_9PASS|nr:hypothetical protein WISP_138507 [Willisornis vidua]
MKTILTEKMQNKMNYCNKEEIKYVEMKISIHETVPCIVINNTMPDLQKKMQTLEVITPHYKTLLVPEESEGRMKKQEFLDIIASEDD